MIYKILILEDNKVDADLISRYLKRSKYSFEVKWVAKKGEFETLLPEFKPDLIISDYNLRYFNAYEVLNIKNEYKSNIPLIVVSGTIGEEEAVNLIKEGATDFLIKHNLVRLPQITVRALEETIEKQEREKAQRALKKEVAFSEKLIDSLSGIFYLLDKDLKIQRVNKRFLDSMGYDWEDVEGRHFTEFISEEDCPKMDEALSKIDDGIDASVELCLESKNGKSEHYLITSSALEQGEKHYIIGTAINISDRIEAENKIKEALHEKNILLAEIHHRVKNNLAVISGIMQLQAFEDEDENVQRKLMSSVSRIKSIALVHEQMYRSKSFSSLRFDESLKLLLDNISRISGTGETDVNLEVDAQKIELNINQALPCAIIVNEVVTNIYKHAFKDRKEGEVYVGAKQINGHIKLVFKDNGVGLPEYVINNDSPSLGFKLIDLLTNQLEGDLDLKSDVGSTVTLTFPKTNKKGVGSSYVA